MKHHITPSQTIIACPGCGQEYSLVDDCHLVISRNMMAMIRCACLQVFKVNLELAMPDRFLRRFTAHVQSC